MMKLLLILLCCISTAFAEKPTGFLWYNVPKDIQQKPGVSFNKLSYTDKDAVLKHYTLEALHKVRFTHKLEDERVFLAWQDFWLKEATLHGKLNELALLTYPEFDFSVTHPTSNVGVKLTESIALKRTENLLRKLSNTHGLLFFYRGSNALDKAQIPILKSFAKTHHFALMAISVDGIQSPLLQSSRVDKGEAAALNVRYFPAVLLVNPQTQQTTPVAYGLTTQDVLARHIERVVTGGLS